MANLFGIPQYDPTLDRENMQINAGLVQNLGAQVRNDLTAIQTNRQLSKLAEGLQGLNVQADDFGQKAVRLMMQYPLAAKSPIGTAAIQQLGAQHKLWQQEQLRRTTGESYFNIPGTDTLVSRKTGNTLELPAGTAPRKPVQVTRDAYQNVTSIRDPYNFNQEQALPDAPIKTSEDAVELERIKQGNRLELQRGKAASAAATTPQEKAVGAALTKATTEYGKVKGEIERLQKMWEQIPEDDQPSFMDPKMKNKDLKYQAGVRANALRGQMAEYEKQVKELSAQLKSFRPDPVIPGLTPVDVVPVAPVNQLGAAAAVDNSIMAPLLNEVRQLDQKTARELLKEANGDRDKARALAKERGYSF